MHGSALEQAAAFTVSSPRFAAAQMVWREEVKAALELISATGDEHAWATSTAGNGVEEGAAATPELKFTEWKKFCGDARRKRVVPTCVIDFPFSDNRGLKVELLERMYCFKGVDDDRHVVLHVHTVLPWSDRGTDAKTRAMKVTSVNVRHADKRGSVFKQEKGDFSTWIVPLDEKLKYGWRTFLEEGKGAQLEWQWGAPKSMPAGEIQHLLSIYDEVLPPP
ncbi:hypothetical protein T484DRAFT_1964993 [Baffinella frigidus]|jgi:hypothetical protein|nr:hypothetical protein T484DRAFT_1964993 [Cryptophyta sp. CCMP2293]